MKRNATLTGRAMRWKRWRRSALALGGGLLLSQWAYWAEPELAFDIAELLTPRLVYRVDTTARLVALSFDDGPHPVHTPRVLDILERHGAKATFFLIGERALRHPEIVGRIRSSGHEVGNHYFTSGSTLGHDEADFMSYLDRTELAIGPLTAPRLFRPPGGVAWSRQLALAQERGYTCVLGSAYPHDAARPPAWYIRWLVTKNMRPGTIAILHDGIEDPSRSIEALPDVLVAGRRAGLQFVAIGTLLAAAAQPGLTPPRPGSAASTPPRP